MLPGAMQLNLMPDCASSSESALDISSTAPFVPLCVNYSNKTDISVKEMWEFGRAVGQ